MSDTIIIGLCVGFPLAAALGLIAFIMRMGTICSRAEEATAHVDVAALEGDLTAYIAALNAGER